MLNQKLQDEDIFLLPLAYFSCILMVHGWRLDPILLFSQVLIIVTVLVAGWENIRLRGLIANMAKLKKKERFFFYLILSWFQVCK
jgi:hypothetical protein